MWHMRTCLSDNCREHCHLQTLWRVHHYHSTTHTTISFQQCIDPCTTFSFLIWEELYACLVSYTSQFMLSVNVMSSFYNYTKELDTIGKLVLFLYMIHLLFFTVTRAGTRAAAINHPQNCPPVRKHGKDGQRLHQHIPPQTGTEKKLLLLKIQ